MYNTNTALHEAYTPFSVTKPVEPTKVKLVSSSQYRVVEPTLLPKEEYCCNCATD